MVGRPPIHITDWATDMRLTAIVAYTFNADLYCPGCIGEALPTGEGEKYDGWAMVKADWMGDVTAEDNLDEIAAAFQIDRADEESFDSGDFPKIVLGADLPEDSTCGMCAGPLDY